MTDLERTTAEERAEWAAFHQPQTGATLLCDCGDVVPCSVARLLADLERAEAERDDELRRRTALGADLARARERLATLEAFVLKVVATVPGAIANEARDLRDEAIRD